MGVIKWSAKISSGGSALKGFFDAGFKAGWRFGSKEYGSSEFDSPSLASSSLKFPGNYNKLNI